MAVLNWWCVLASAQTTQSVAVPGSTNLVQRRSRVPRMNVDLHESESESSEIGKAGRNKDKVHSDLRERWAHPTTGDDNVNHNNRIYSSDLSVCEPLQLATRLRETKTNNSHKATLRLNKNYWDSLHLLLRVSKFTQCVDLSTVWIGGVVQFQVKLPPKPKVWHNSGNPYDKEMKDKACFNVW